MSRSILLLLADRGAAQNQYQIGTVFFYFVCGYLKCNIDESQTYIHFRWRLLFAVTFSTIVYSTDSWLQWARMGCQLISQFHFLSAQNAESSVKSMFQLKTCISALWHPAKQRWIWPSQPDSRVERAMESNSGAIWFWIIHLVNVLDF